MRKRIFLVLILFVTLLGLVSPCLAQDPVILDNVDAYVVVLNDGRMNVLYTLIFTEREDGRDRIRELGPFPQDHTIVSASGQGPDGAFSVNLSGGPEYYQVNFERPTRRNQQYEVAIRYTVDRSVFDETTIKGDPYRIIGWAPFQWGLPIARQEIRYVLPIELPEGVTEAEQVTDEIVDATGLIVEDTSAFDRWVYFATPDETTGKAWLSIFVREDDLPPEAHMMPRFYLPAQAITTTRETPIPLTQATPVLTPTAEGVLGSTRAAAGLTLCVGSFVTLIVLGLLLWALRKREPKPQYEPPEIEIETFQTPGVVPDLNAIETAFYMGNSTKTVTLIVLALEQKGVVNVVNYHPLQMEILKPDADVAPYEQALLDAIQEDGTIDKQKIPQILEAVSAAVQPKMWNADPEATRRTYQRRIESAWEEYEREQRREPHPRRMPNYMPWIILSDRRLTPRPATAASPSATGREPGPLARAAGEAVAPMERMADNLTRSVEEAMTGIVTRIEQAFGQGEGTEAGYDACHSACHSACVHDACHSA
ncbi:MAG: hypothetical protein ACLFV5_11385, partial [Anaerolineales bacterium]